jgi:hypothetical protein
VVTREAGGLDPTNCHEGRLFYYTFPYLDLFYLQTLQ